MVYGRLVSLIRQQQAFCIGSDQWSNYLDLDVDSAQCLFPFVYTATHLFVAHAHRAQPCAHPVIKLLIVCAD